jgi:hypothetical protein
MMGEQRKEARRVSHPMVCGLCGHIRAGLTWVENRRTTYERNYSEGVCPECRAGALKAHPGVGPQR